MHQILGLRPFFNEKKQRWDITDNTFFKRNWRVKSLSDLFANLDELLKKIPKEERWNLFYTVAFCAEGKREFREQTVMVFDVDKLDQSKKKQYIPIVLSCLGVREEDTAIVDSGNGLHFIIALTAPIVDPTFFESNRRHYNAVCEKIKAALTKENLPGEPDPAVFDPRRIMRLPGTENRKEGKDTKQCTLIRGQLREIEFNLAQLSGLPTVQAADQITAQQLKKYPTPDTAAILQGCDFLKWCKENPNDVHENQWYGMLSLLPRLPPDGRQLAHDYSKGHKAYTPGETESKIDQALAASGPRTCENINKLWGKCGNCKYNGKVNSPIMIQGEDYIKTQDQGFHEIYIDAKGNAKPGKPCYEDLRRFFHKLTPYIVLGESGICLTWNGKFWQEMPDAYLQSFAQDHFRPFATTNMTIEFKNLVCRTNLRHTSWFVSTTNRKVNFQNGVLDLDTMRFGPHSQDYGFRYVLSYDYDQNAVAPQFERFMLEVMDGRKDLVDVLLEYAGYSFSNDTCWAQKALIMTGEGSNGKSTFMDVLKELAGAENYSSLTLGDIKNEASRRMLEGKLFNLAEETPTYAMAESSLFKNLVSGGETTIKVLYKQPYTITNKAKLMFACNELPKTRDTTRGFFRRLIIVPFDRKFIGKKKDPFIKNKLLSELPGIFNLVVNGYRTLKAQEAFTRSAAIERELRVYRKELDSVKAWYDDCVKDHLDDANSSIIVPLSQLYGSYKIYAESRGEKPELLTTMARRLSTILPEYNKRKKQDTFKGRREQCFRGVKFGEAAAF